MEIYKLVILKLRGATEIAIKNNINELRIKYNQ
jgi:hypothetical protein